MSRRLEVKVCGVRSTGQVLVLEAALARNPRPSIQFVGINLVPASRRCVSLSEARAMVLACRRVIPVGIVADLDTDAASALSRELGLRWLQLHGAESPAVVATLARRLGIIKALGPAEASDIGQVLAYAEAGAHRLLLDGRQPGSGLRNDQPGWLACPSAIETTTLAQLLRCGTPLWLAGGLHPRNVSEAVAGAKLAPAARIAGVDAASGVEADGQFSVDLALAFALAACGDGDAHGSPDKSDGRTGVQSAQGAPQ